MSFSKSYHTKLNTFLLKNTLLICSITTKKHAKTPSMFINGLHSIRSTNKQAYMDPKTEPDYTSSATSPPWPQSMATFNAEDAVTAPGPLMN